MSNFRRFAAFRDLHEAVPSARRGAKLVTGDGQDLSPRHRSYASEDETPQQAQPAPAAVPVASPAVASRPAPAPAAQAGPSTTQPQAQPQRKFVEPTETLPGVGQDGLMTDRQGRPLPNMPMLTNQLSSRIQQYIDSYLEANPHLNEMDPRRLSQGIMTGRAWKTFIQAIHTHLKKLNPAMVQPPNMETELGPIVHKFVVNSQKHNTMRAAQASERQKAQAATAARMQQQPAQQQAAQPANQGGGGGLWAGVRKAFGI